MAIRGGQMRGPWLSYRGLLSRSMITGGSLKFCIRGLLCRDLCDKGMDLIWISQYILLFGSGYRNSRGNTGESLTRL